MKIWKSAKAGFTLVELLVVIAIISIVAMAMFSAVKGARRQAQAAKCQANMKNLHTAMVAYFSDKEAYPTANSYEWYYRSGESWHEMRGWVSWVPKSDSTPRRREINGKKQTPWDENNKKSHAEDFVYPSKTDERMRDAISEGGLYKYAGKNHETYRCPACPDDHLAFAMNKWFHCQYDRSDIYQRYASVARKDANKMVLFVEIGGTVDSEEGTKEQGKHQGLDGKKEVTGEHWADDACWDWDEKVANKNSTPEVGHFVHRKAGHMFTHVVFLDGHVASIGDNYRDFNDEYKPTKKATKNEDVFYKLGRGSYD